MVNRYMTPLKYKDGNGKERMSKVHFELDPIELMDWSLENPFDANELLASITELRDVEQAESHDMTQDDIRTMLGVIKLLSRISAGRPTDDGEYFIKDPNWTSSYAYRGFREFLMTHPKEVQQFLMTLLDNDVMAEFTKNMAEANTKNELEMTEEASTKRTGDSGPETLEKMREKVRMMEAKAQAEESE